MNLIVHVFFVAINVVKIAMLHGIIDLNMRTTL